MELFARADEAKAGSCDIHTKIGAIVVDAEGRELVRACNTMPEGLDVTPECLERPAKYQWIAHAEVNAICHAARRGIKLEGAIMVMSCNPVPCTECARAIIQSGIRMVVGRDMDQVASSRWDSSCEFALSMLTKAGVAVVYVSATPRVVMGNGTLSDESKAFLKLFEA